jgi:putative PEP-CTERM system histidine kinase
MELVVTAGALFCALAYLTLGALAFAGRARLAGSSGGPQTGSAPIAWLIVASGLTAVWSLSLLLETRTLIPFYTQIILVLEVSRTFAWVGFLATLVGLSDSRAMREGRAGLDGWMKLLMLAAMILPVLGVAGQFAVAIIPDLYTFASMTSFVSGTGMMLLLVVGMLLLENLYRNAGPDQRWGTRYLCLGLALVFVYDFFFYAESLLFKRMDVALGDARPYVAGLAGPLIALSLARVRFWSIDVHVSRQMVFHSAALVGAGIYLIAMSAVGYGIRRFGGEAGTVFQVAFLAFAGIMLLAILASGSLRSRLRLFIARNFYSSKYDYREEWLRFITTLGTGEEATSIAQRIVWAIAPIVDSTAAALWVMDRSAGVLKPVVSWNYGDRLAPFDPNDAFVKRVRTTSGVLVLGDGPDMPPGALRAADLVPDAIRATRDTWLIVPLIHRGRLNGMLLLGQPRAPRTLDFEDRNLLATVASQAASYLAEDRAAGALAEARKMEEFNQRFTFVAHDLKNIVNQLSILVSNARRHGDNPEFQKDMIATVANSVERMNGMMADLTDRSGASRSSGLETLDIPVFDLVDMLEGFAADWQAQGARVRAEVAGDALIIATKRDVLISALNHMVQNAVDASGPAALVRVLLVRGETSFSVEVIDNGPGMEPDFVESVYFAPFGSTKEGGYGIGGFQIRQHIRDLGAKLDVLSTPGHGTTLRVTFPHEKFAHRPAVTEPDTSDTERAEHNEMESQ